MSKIKELEKKISELESGWKRSQADFENFKKKTEAEKSSWINIARSEALLELLPILDNIYLAISSTPEKLINDSWVTGFSHIIKQVEEKLTELGISRINPLPGQDFDPRYHEAISTIADKSIESGKIIKTERCGYQIEEQVLRPARVIVAK